MVTVGKLRLNLIVFLFDIQISVDLKVYNLSLLINDSINTFIQNL